MEGGNRTEGNGTFPIEAGSPPVGPEGIVVPVVFGIILFTGVLGNCVSIYIVVKFGRMRTVTNHYVLNLSVTDLAFLLCCVPFTAAVFSTATWRFGTIMCKVVFYFMQATVQATCLTLTALSVDRYLAIVYPLESRKLRTTRVAVWANTCIWTGSLLLSLPVAVYREVVEWYYFGTHYYCMEMWPSKTWERAYMIYTVLISYVVPLLVSLVSFVLIAVQLTKTGRPMTSEDPPNSQLVKRNRKVTQMIALLSLLFALCWLPIHVLNLSIVFVPDFPMTQATMWLKIVAVTFSYANSCINPFIYVIVGKSSSMREAVQARRFCRDVLTFRGSFRRGFLVFGRGGHSTTRTTRLSPRKQIEDKKGEGEDIPMTEINKSENHHNKTEHTTSNESRYYTASGSSSRGTHGCC
ncbi:G-protein coupled receptor 54-like [Branchiostoma floridae x Branchiostoma belcheri]